MTAFFCPRCWKEVEEGCRVCPNCGYEIDSFDSLSYEEKMISALNHSVDEFRINAINVLGRIGGERAVEALRKLAWKENSVPILLEVVKALHSLSREFESAKNALKELERHRARVVAERAKELLEQTFNNFQ